MLLNGEDANRKEKGTLTKWFGDSFELAAAFRKKRDSRTQISPTESIGVRKCTDFLVQCERGMENISSLKILSNEQKNQKLAKLNSQDGLW